MRKQRSPGVFTVVCFLWVSLMCSGCAGSNLQMLSQAFQASKDGSAAQQQFKQALTGKDAQGNTLTEEQRQAALDQGTTLQQKTSQELAQTNNKVLQNVSNTTVASNLTPTGGTISTSTPLGGINGNPMQLGTQYVTVSEGTQQQYLWVVKDKNTGQPMFSFGPVGTSTKDFKITWQVDPAKVPSLWQK